MFRQLPFAILPLLAACATTGGAAPLAPSEWTFVLIDGAKPVSGNTRLTIAKDQIGANVGCNNMGGELRIEAGNLIVGPIISTQMFCDGVMLQEQALGRLLRASPTYRLDGDRLTLADSQHSAELTRKHR